MTPPDAAASTATALTPLARLLVPGAWRVAIATVALVIVSVCGVNSVRGIGEPFPGFFVWENLFVPAIGAPSWSGAEAGLPYHSWLLSADGVALGDAADLEQVLAAKRPGDVVRYEAELGGEVHTVDVPVEVFGLRHYAESTGIYLFDALALIALAVVMLYLKPHGADSGALFLFAITLALYLATAIDLFGPYHFREAYFFFAGMAPTSALLVLSWFPVGRRRGPWETPLLAGAALVSITFAIASNLAFLHDRELLLLLDRLFHVYLAASVLAAMAFFGWYFTNTTDAIVRQRTKVVLIASLGAFLPAVALVAIYAGLASIPFNVLTVFFVVFPVGIGYAIARHDLFDVDRFLKRALAYLVLSAVVLGTYGLAVALLELAFESLTGVPQRLTSGLLVLALILVLNPTRDRVQAIVDRLYDRRRYEYRDVVRAASRRFSSILDFDALVRMALELIDETVQPLSAELFTVDADGVPLRRALLLYRDGPGSAGRLEIADRPAPELAAVAVSLRDAEVLAAAMPAAHEGNVVVERVLAAGMLLEGRQTGFVAIGRKRSGLPHTSDDADLLRTMADQLTVALENAQAYRTIGSLNVDLAGKAAALEESNRELRSAQRQLVQSERLAAIGELSGAVAHAMRNPLAAIKMAAEFGSMEFAGQGAAENFRDISSEAGRLEHRIRELLDFARPFEPRPERVDFGVLVARAVDVSRGRASQKGVELDLATGAGTSPVALDAALFEQVVVELVANAIDASPAGGRVEIACGRSTGETGPLVWLRVADSGPGIPADKKDRIFDLFFTTKKTGTGFGLATVRKVVERHGGRIDVDAGGNGRGASFTVYVPAIQAMPNLSSR
jgi:signal transduction histidine kinase